MSDAGSSHRKLPDDEEQESLPNSSLLDFNPLSQVPDDTPTVISSTPPDRFPEVRQGAHPSELGVLLEGQRLGHFELIQFIGGGGMGAVFRALDTMLNRTVAVKVLSTDHSRDQETQRRFKNEAQSAARLDHENIARVYYVGEDRGVHYIVFEYIKGINIRDLVDRDGPLPLASAFSYTAQIAEALLHASDRDVVHRDIKPSNVLIMRHGRAKLVDMGLARLHQVEHTDNDLTASGVTLGTFDYISPEQARDPRTADVRSDLYSLGCTLFFMLTGRPPFPEGTVLQKLLQHQGDAPPDPKEIRTDLPVEISELVMRLLAKSPEDRFQTPDALIDALASLAASLDISAVVPQVPRRHAPAKRRRPRFRLAPDSPLRRHLPWAAPLLLLVVILGAAEMFLSQSDPTHTLPPLGHVQAPPGDGEKKTPDAHPDSGKPPVTPERKAIIQPATDTTPPFSEPGGQPSGKSAVPPNVAPKAKPEDDSTEPVTAPPDLKPEIKIIEQTQNPLEGQFAVNDRPLGLAQPDAAAEAAIPPAASGLTAEPPAADASVLEADPSADSQPPADVPVVANIPVNDEVLVVSRAVGPGMFANLQQACAAAKSDDVIELCYDGAIVEHPLMLSNLNLTIRAGKDHQPQIVFRPGPEDVDPQQYPRGMLNVAGGKLTIVGVDVRLDLADAVPAERWALIETRGAGTIDFQQCVLSIRNANEARSQIHQDVAFFNVRRRPGRAAMPRDGGESAMQTAPVSLRLENGIVRGEADLVRCDAPQNVKLYWNNGLLVCRGRMFKLKDGGMPRAAERLFEVELRHVTALMEAGLLAVEYEQPSQQPLRINVKCDESILIVKDTSSLIEQSGNTDDTVEFAVSWSGDRNFYERLQMFWKLGEGGPGGELQPLNRMSWKDYWQRRPDGSVNLPRYNVVAWQRPPDADVPLYRRTPDDFTLRSRGADNPALSAASDAREVGFRVDSLPDVVDPGFPSSDTPLPPEPSPLLDSEE